MKNRKKDVLTNRARLAVEVMEAFNMFNDISIDFFAKFDLTPQQYNVIAILHHGPFSTSDILEWMVEKNAGVSRLVDRLVKKELVTKKTNKTDKRLLEIELTHKGKKLYQEISEQINQLDELSSNLDDGEVEQLISLLVKLKGF